VTTFETLQIFKCAKNREDSSDFDDLLTKSIATTQTFFQNISRAEQFSQRAKERKNERKKFSAALPVDEIELTAAKRTQAYPSHTIDLHLVGMHCKRLIQKDLLHQHTVGKSRQ